MAQLHSITTLITQNGPVFPIKPNGKKPLTDHGFKDASSDQAQIKRWQREFPNCNWGMPTGNIVVLDIDAKHAEALEWLRDQQDIHGPFNTREILTPSTGTHSYFVAPEGVRLKSTASQIAPGVDTRAEGGYVVIPPSSINGNAYEVVNDVPPAPLPDWLLAIWPKAGERPHREYPSAATRLTELPGAPCRIPRFLTDSAT